MAFDGLFLNDQHWPVGNQPVPLRLAPFIFGMKPNEYFRMIAEANQQNGVGITVYEYDSTKRKKVVHPQVLRNLILNLNISLEQIPPEYYVYSEDLILQMTNYVDNCIGDRQSAHESNIGLVWNPALGDAADCINASSDFHQFQPANLKNIKNGQKRRQKTDERNIGILKIYREYESRYLAKHQSAKYTNVLAAKEMNKDERFGLNEMKPGSLRKLIGRIKNMDKRSKK